MKKGLLIIVAILSIQFNYAQNTNPWPATGNIGIGTTSPNRPLAVNGIILSWGSNDTPGAGGLSLGDAGGHYWGFRRTTTGSHLAVDGWNGSTNVEYMRINANNGHVGIGTTAPNTKLEVAGEIRQSGRSTYLYGANSNENQALMFAGWGVAHGGIYWRGDTRTFTINTGEHADMVGNYGNANLVVTGNIGIGTTSPTAPLVIARTAGQGDAKIILDAPDASLDTYVALSADGSQKFALWRDRADDNLKIVNTGFSSGNTIATFTSSGNVGIGTTNPQSKLAVKGDVLCTKVKVISISNFPDYVFHTSYRLRPLSEVAQYIQQHHHLPEVPSAAEVEKNGLDLGDNQATLLKKIEELTLYLIEQNKKLDDQIKKNEDQQREIDALKKQVKQNK